MTKEILCTIGPASLNRKTINRLEELGVNLLRINLSHTEIKDLPDIVKNIRELTKLPICFDSEGAQIRTGKMGEGTISLTENSFVKVMKEVVMGNSSMINFYPLGILSEVKAGDFVSIDFNSVLCQVVEAQDEFLQLKVLSGGVVGSNKAVTVEREISMNPFTEKDLKAFKIAKEMDIKHVALSFVNHSSDVDKLRKILPSDVQIISKIECRNALNDLDEIIKKSDAILIDRGDMSRQVNIERIPQLQKEIIKRTHQSNGKVYVATNLLESMINSSSPTRAEVNDIYNTLNDGADGLVLAAETAVGKYPVRAVEIVVKMIHEFEKPNNLSTLSTQSFDAYFSNPLSLLIEPHGGELVSNIASNSEIEDSKGLVEIDVDESIRLDCYQITVGTYSPLKGFMGSKDLSSILNNNRLENGLPWTVPILFQINEQSWNSVKVGESLKLNCKGLDDQYLLKINEKFKIDIEEVSKKWFLTSDLKHPGVNRLYEKGSYVLAGEVYSLNKNSTSFNPYSYTPAQLRFIFNQKGWSRVVGFHTRNVPHRAHEFLQKTALSESLVDGLFINPVIGPKKDGDFLPEPILKAYQHLVEFGFYPKNQVILGAFDYYPGCSHFIVGRDHAGVGDYYKPKDNEEFFDNIGDIGIKPIFFDEIAYNPIKGDYEVVKDGTDYLRISGTQVRKALKEGGDVPDWFMRDIIVDYLKNEVSQGRPIFC